MKILRVLNVGENLREGDLYYGASEWKPVPDIGRMFMHIIYARPMEIPDFFTCPSDTQRKDENVYSWPEPIAFKDRIPEDAEAYLVFCPTHLGWQIIYGNTAKEIYGWHPGLTHWLPMPPAPKQEKTLADQCEEMATLFQHGERQDGVDITFSQVKTLLKRAAEALRDVE